jgi:phage terminase large subunit
MRMLNLFEKRRIMINRRCEGLIKELYSMEWDQKKADNGVEAPVKDNDHGPDALRYVINSKSPQWIAMEASHYV